MKPTTTTKAAWALALLTLLPPATPSDPTPTISSLSALPYDTNDRLSSHILAVPSHCIDTVDYRLAQGVLGHHLYALTNEATNAVFGHLNPQPDECLAACLEQGTPRSVVARPLPHRYWREGKVDQDGDGERVEEMNLMDFVYSDGCGKVEYGMVNYHERVSWIFWC